MQQIYLEVCGSAKEGSCSFFQTQRKPFLFQSPVSKLNLDFNDRLFDEVEAAAAGAAGAAAAAGAERACSCTRHKPEPDLSQFFFAKSL